MGKRIIDNMKKESKISMFIMIFGYFLFILTLFERFCRSSSVYGEDMFMMLLIYFLFGTIGLYFWLYSVKYNLEVNEEKMILKTLFSKVETNICDITKYTCSRYKKSEFYQFVLFVKDKKILVNTRYKEEFEKILNKNIKND